VSAVRQITRQSPLSFSQQAVFDFMADVNLESRTIVLTVLAERVGLGEEPLSFGVGVLHTTGFADVAGGAEALTIDFAPTMPSPSAPTARSPPARGGTAMTRARSVTPSTR
jgi:hypothetical protein